MLKWSNVAIAVLSILLTGAFVIPMLQGEHRHKKEVAELRDLGKKSPAHQFVVDKFIECRSEMFAPSQDACVARIVDLSRVKGVEFEDKVTAAIRDLKLDQ